MPIQGKRRTMETASSSSSSMESLTRTQVEQRQLEITVKEIYKAYSDLDPSDQSAILELQRDRHLAYVMRGLHYLGPSYAVLDASRPWLCYWILHSVSVLGKSIDTELKQRTIDFLCHCQDPEGGYGGGPGQMPHLATTYAAVNTLVILGGKSALSSVNRHKMLAYLLRMKDPSGGFRMHDAGEMDVRGCYTAIAVASMLNILDPSLVENVSDYILSCQTYEGGIAGEPGAEAHGGYTYCGLAALALINEVDRLDLLSLLDWTVFRQGRVEGGFQGRTNKLVDGCYSFWQGGTFPIIQRIIDIVQQQLKKSYVGRDCLLANENLKNLEKDINSSKSYCASISELDRNSEYSAEEIFPAINCFQRIALHIESIDEDTLGSQGPQNNISSDKIDFGLLFLEKGISCAPPFNVHALQGYILLCSQVVGGLRDKPGKSPDYYHTCYCLSGLSSAQYSWSSRSGVCPPTNAVLGPFRNLLEPVHPLYNVVLEKYLEAQKYFGELR